MIDKYKIKDYSQRLDKEKLDDALKMLYMWIKQDVITLGEFRELVKKLTI